MSDRHKPESAPGTVELTLPIHRVRELHGAFKSLDGYTTAIGSDEGATQAVTEPYRWTKNPKVYLHIAMNINEMQPHVDASAKAISAVIKAKTKKGELGINAKKDPAVVAEFIEQQERIMEEEVKVKLKTIDFDDLQLEENPVPSSTLSILMRHNLLTGV